MRGCRRCRGLLLYRVKGGGVGGSCWVDVVLGIGMEALGMEERGDSSGDFMFGHFCKQTEKTKKGDRTRMVCMEKARRREACPKHMRTNRRETLINDFLGAANMQSRQSTSRRLYKKLQ